MEDKRLWRYKSHTGLEREIILTLRFWPEDEHEIRKLSNDLGYIEGINTKLGVTWSSTSFKKMCVDWFR